MAKRQPSASGRFYPGDRNALESKIRDCFENDLGPGNVPEEGVGDGFVGGIVPHAGFDFSGPCAAYMYERLVESGIPDVVVIFGSMHYSRKDYAVDDRDYMTPLGTVKNVFSQMDTELDVDREVHDREHSIEVQLPFLQYFSESFKILPVAVSTREPEILSELSESIKKSLKGFETVFLASTDFTHCGPRYGQSVPSVMSPGEFSDEQDVKALNMISEGDISDFLREVEREDVAMCGPGAVGAVMECTEDASCELLCHYSSFDIMGGQDSVGYASVAFYEES